MSTTLRQFLINQSTVPQGSTVREHLDNPLTGGTGDGETIYITASEVVNAAGSINIIDKTDFAGSINNTDKQTSLDAGEGATVIRDDSTKTIIDMRYM